MAVTLCDIALHRQVPGQFLPPFDPTAAVFARLWLLRVRGYQRSSEVQTPPEIHFQDMDRSPAVEEAVRERALKLEKLFDGITSCHAYVHALQRNQRKGNHYEVRLEVRVPGTELAVSNRPGDRNAHEDVYVAVRDAFDAMERQLKRWKERVRGD